MFMNLYVWFENSLMICFEFVEARVSFCQAPSTSLGNCSSLPIGEQKTVYCWGSQCCLKRGRLPGLVFLLSLCPPPCSCLSCLRSCLPACLPSGLGCCVRLFGLAFPLSPVLSPSLFPIWSVMLFPLFVSWLVWDAVSTSLVLSLLSSVLSPSLSPIWCAVSASLGLPFFYLPSCLPACLPSGLGCCVRLPGLVFLLSPVLSPSLSHLDWDAAFASLVLSLLFPVLSPPSSLLSGVRAFLVCLVGLPPFFSPILSSSWSGMPCLWSGLVSRISCAVCATVWGHMVV